ncbi:MAG: biosynthetic arginine decarboxylase [Candidatus Lernaella stagnicola]|nr:biosynthetic arginine decarboxylase [Candidatus Lernaella stagnicola]
MAEQVNAADKLYFPEAWGAGYFSINGKGRVQVDVNADGHHKVDLYELVEQVREKGLTPPYLFRFPQILEHRIEHLHNAFAKAIEEFGYGNEYRGVFPVKVNHRREVMEAIIKAGRRFQYGVEVGSKPEMYLALALPLVEGSLLLCNGFKDDNYMRMAMHAQRLGRNVVIILESLADVQRAIRLADKMKIRVPFGIRVRLHARGSGRWEESGGEYSKFGLSTGEVLEVLRVLEKADRLDDLVLLHFHVGSQITEIKRIKNAIKEAARVYSKLKKTVNSLKYLNVGGGLGVDYDGSKTSSDASTNYTVQEYANDVVYMVMDVCDNENIDPPMLVSESGRAITAYHAMLVVNVHRAPENVLAVEGITLNDDDPQVVHELHYICENLSRKNYREFYHDALEYRDELHSLFNLGFLELEDRARGEALFFDICHRSVKFAKRERGPMREEFDDLQRDLAYRYICNFSVFQSLPDSWAVGQLFPIMPIHRLNETPDQAAILCDITCDSDGVIENFIDIHDERRFLELHRTTSKELYWIGIFLVGAYQDIIGDFHNLFGKINEAHVLVGEGGRAHFQKILPGDSIRESLRFVRYDPDELTRSLERTLAKRTGDELLTQREAKRILDDFKSGLEGTTYVLPNENARTKKR